jgi:hypothetical protein
MLIIFQERSFAKRKEIWKTVQAKVGIARPVQLVLDMKVRWSSTYLMLDRAERNKAVSTQKPSLSESVNTHAFHSSLTLSSMNCAGKRVMALNATKYAPSNWTMTNGSGLICFWVY